MYRAEGPNGGNGGKGADIILHADKQLGTLIDLRYQQNYFADNGQGAGARSRAAPMPRIL